MIGALAGVEVKVRGSRLRGKELVCSDW
jgi:hypothetical protein